MSDKIEPSELQRVWSVISHDLATPLLVIDSNLKRQNLAMIPSTQSTVNRVRQLVSRWNRKLLTEQFPLAKQPVNLVTCVNAGIDNYQSAYGLEDKSRIVANLAAGTVLGDEATIQHMLYELLDNAEYAAETVNASDNHHAIVFLSSAIDENRYHLQFKNIGSLIADADLPQIFHPYFTTKTSHIGLGLTYCQQLMAAMGGDIACHPHRDGVEFILTFPLAE